MTNKMYCMECDRMVKSDKVCDAECEEMAKEVKAFLKLYDKEFGDEPPLEVLQGIVDSIKQGKRDEPTPTL